VSIPNIYIPCCDDSLPIVKINSYLFNKFWPDAVVNYLGFSQPQFKFYNKNHHFHSLSDKQEGGAANWTKYIYDFLKTIDDTHIIFSIDDYWLCETPNYEKINKASNLMTVNDKIGRFDLTFDSQVEGNLLPIKNLEDHGIVVKHPLAPYRVSTQPAIWKLEYLLEIMNNNWSPWQFEINGSQLASTKYTNTNHTFAFYDKDMDKYPIRTIAKGAVSRHNPNKYNVLGLSTDTIKEMVKENFFSEEELIWGQWQGEVPTFHEKGGYDFHPGFLNYHDTSKTHFREYFKTYDDPEYPMLTVNLFDSSFSHTLTHPDFGYISTNAEKSPRGKKIRFIQGNKSYHQDCGITLFTDNYLNQDIISSVDSKIKVGWILEPPVIHPWPYNNVDSYINELDYLFTFSDELSEKYEKAITFPWCSIRLNRDDWGVHEKTKQVSMIASNKTHATGHKLRHRVAKELSDKFNIDLWGGGYNFFPQHGKILALKDYMFSIVIQNCQLDTFFTDFVDPLATGTIPIFWGTRNVDKYFNPDGIIFFDTFDELESILGNLTEKDYYNRLEAVKDNYNRSKKYWRSDDQLAEMLHKILREQQ
tara:strand:+ start:12155 stop:13915 length:1761 start_codon:yes stop_codon:yes gene_type:complete